MKQRGSIVVLSVIILFLFIRLQEESKKEIVNLEEFTQYYETSVADNGGFELIESFYNFERVYHFPNQYMEIPKKEEEIKKEETKYPTKSTYIVKKGDTPSKIAAKFGMSLNSFRANNPNMDKNLRVGSSVNVVSEDGVFYKLQKGDSVSRIAVKYKVKAADIVKYNNISPQKMRVGQEIFLKSPDYKAFLEKEKPKLSKKELDKKLKEKQEKEDQKIYAENKRTGKSTQKPQEEPEKEEGKKEDSDTGGTASSGGFSMPVRYAGVSSPYGSRFHPVLKRYIFHSGVDLVAKYVPLRAARAGVVSFAGNMSGYGKIIIIKHDNGFETRYAHLSQISTRVGERVERGELIGKTGNTGRTTGPHLHFEIRRFGKTLNPMKYL
ncbi:LysM peptidoglycan-binding domain-containing protein [Fusobacterium necrophorum]|uniref:Peptidase n=2 Tax=Fusobacterium necrophorum TaxID=859 RepID=A0AB73BYE8_9FUSO|nr:M23 family metallopeptidase [Fusobacterium necrophorum]AYZ73165.1 LysM peptidoglycan-binding domain-containing protein [Fusobacterium necrophorum]AZW08838.1 LysM peptidoglycan-binding domain-containing protein [Fusobacterium necrophorum subsp. necrophorum]KDE61619.1 peptidase [Fusobacterium necrophorum BFTR-1]KDE65114.1 peptidase [Fusobacterium necrophorum BL]KDE68119.1 peptidase [Fusobacterium necrophorum DJ-1]